VNETYDRMKYGADTVSEKIGVPAAGRAWNERIYPAVVGTATRTVQQGSVATFEGADRVVAGGGAAPTGMRGRIHRAVEAMKQGVRELFKGPAAAPKAQSPSPNGG
jgi:hypothetical protein